MDLGLKGKKVIINGGSRGIGKAALELFAAEGCDVAFISRNQDRVQTTVAELKAFGGKVIGKALDMNDLDAYTAWLKDAAAELGGCDIFIHNASSSGSSSTGGTMDWDLTYKLDMKAAVLSCEALHEQLKASGVGSVILMSSTAAVETFIYPQAFNAIKAAILTYAKQLSQLWAADDIRVNTVSPGPTEYPGGNWEAIKEAMPELYAQHRAMCPTGRFGTLEEVAKSIVFLASPASSYTSGTNLVIDGGYTKRVQF
ncbi:SDR family NAD(P)-dependent oxidoreductase [Paraburkholderia sp. BR14374]|uniref:SDR family NAD(P)-dependent oxidoreductase n=1 Tax=Paraburkholderia sp. BR14374 TaxID=3237007 RepID=UPI0034CF5781